MADLGDDDANPLPHPCISPLTVAALQGARTYFVWPGLARRRGSTGGLDRTTATTVMVLRPASAAMTAGFFKARTAALIIVGHPLGLARSASESTVRARRSRAWAISLDDLGSVRHLRPRASAPADTAPANTMLRHYPLVQKAREGMDRDRYSTTGSRRHRTGVQPDRR